MKKFITLSLLAGLFSTLVFAQSGNAANPGMDKKERFEEYLPISPIDGPMEYTSNYVEVPGIPYGFVDISGTGVLVLSGDDAGTPFNLGAPFPFYGTTYTQLAVTTNGYLSTLLTDNGPDLSNDCPLPSPPSTGGGARIYAYHDDIVTSVYYQYFPVSPVANPNTISVMGASVFQWVGTHYNGALPVEVEAFLYDNGDIAFFIKSSGGEYGSGATFGIQNESATEGLTLLCNTNYGPDQKAFFITANLGRVPVSNWALFIGIGLILVFAVLRFRKIF